jgi:LuxR family maltose regulon positive regulatory protein
MVGTARVGLSAAKLRVPVARPEMVPRVDLVDRLMDPAAPPVTAVVAPAGYGKTTLLAQWADHRVGGVGWVSADERDNDPAVLLAHIAAAVDGIEELDPSVFPAMGAAGSVAAGAPLLADAIAALDVPIALVLDHFEVVTRRECLDAVGELALRFPEGSRLAVASRDRAPVPVARLRARGDLLEIGADDLSMGGQEAAALLKGAGVELAEAEVEDLVEHTEGWPVGLYLAALAVNAGGRSQPESTLTFTGDDRFMGDYLRSEFLERVSPDEATFLTRTSVLDQLCGPLCDAVLQRPGSAVVLDELERRNLLVVPLDRRRESYRYHHLFREQLRTELERREPDIVPSLHRRAATWYEENRRPESAVEHAQAAGDVDSVARLVLDLASSAWASGRADAVERWIRWFDDEGVLDRFPGIAVAGALMHGLTGRPGDTERWAAAAERAPSAGVLSDGSTVEGTVAYLRALLCRDGLEAMRRDARAALEGLHPASPHRAAALHAEGLAHLLEGASEGADALFAHAVDTGVSAGTAPSVAVVLAGRGLIAVGRGDWPATEALEARAEAVMRGGDLDDHWTSALVYAWFARTALHRGDVAAAQRHLARAARVRGLLTCALPVVSVQALLEMARAYVALTDRAGARTVLRQARDILQQRRDLGDLPHQVEDLWRKLDAVDPGVPGASSLTTAELRLLPLLSTHLSFREIGERLYVSRHTVKTQAISIYRKLGVSSRSDAIARMHELGLLARG